MEQSWKWNTWNPGCEWNTRGTRAIPGDLHYDGTATGALVVYLEGMLDPNPTYVSNVKAIYNKCIRSKIDLFIYTDAPIDPEVNGRCIFTQSRMVKVAGATHANVDALLDASCAHALPPIMAADFQIQHVLRAGLSLDEPLNWRSVTKKTRAFAVSKR